MKNIKYSFTKSVFSTVSFLLFIGCFFMSIPTEASLDAEARIVISDRNIDKANAIIFLFNEPFSIIFASIFSSALNFQITYALLATVLCSIILKLPLYYVGFFLLTPPGNLLTFNITPSLIAFSVLNYHLLGNRKFIIAIIGIVNHFTAILMLIPLFIKSSFKRDRTFKLLVLVVIIVIGAATIPLILEKITAYSGSSGSETHVILAIILLVIFLFSKKPHVRFGCIFYILLLTSSMFISTKVASRFAFGADLLVFHLCYLYMRSLLAKLFPMPAERSTPVTY